jgi:hypothetical protein
MLIQPTFPRVKLSGLQIKSAILLELLGLKLLKCYKTSWFKPNILHPTNPRKKKKTLLLYGSLPHWPIGCPLASSAKVRPAKRHRWPVVLWVT